VPAPRGDPVGAARPSGHAMHQARGIRGAVHRCRSGGAIVTLARGSCASMPCPPTDQPGTLGASRHDGCRPTTTGRRIDRGRRAERAAAPWAGRLLAPRRVSNDIRANNRTQPRVTDDATGSSPPRRPPLGRPPWVVPPGSSPWVVPLGRPTGAACRRRGPKTRPAGAATGGAGPHSSPAATALPDIPPASTAATA